jgi:hypothetical protein
MVANNERLREALMFTTTAVVLAVGIARWVEGRTTHDAFSGAILIMLGVVADRIT